MKIDKLRERIMSNKRFSKAGTASAFVYKTEWEPDDGEQYISDGFAFYSLRGYPKQTEETILELLEIPKEERDNVSVYFLDHPCNVLIPEAGFFEEPLETEICEDKLHVIGKSRDAYTLLSYLEPLDMPYTLHEMHSVINERIFYTAAVGEDNHIEAILFPVSADRPAWQ